MPEIDDKMPFLWLEGSEHEQVAVADCGCRLARDHADSGDPAVWLCPMHEFAGEMLTILRRMSHTAWPYPDVVALLGKLEARA